MMKGVKFVGSFILTFTISGVALAQQWDQRGTTLQGESGGNQAGTSVALNYEGNVLAYGEIGYDGVFSDAGIVRIYKWDGTSWSKMVAPITGPSGSAYMGSSVALDSAGETIVVGARYAANTDNGNPSGIVKVYQRNGSLWTQKGNTLNGINTVEFFGYDVDISSDGNIVIVGISQWKLNNTMVGRAKVFQWDGSTWVQKGSDIEADAVEGKFGGSVAINRTGDIIAVSSINANMYTKVYKWNGTQWVQMGSTINNEATSVDLNGDGTILAIGNSSGGNKVGRVYEWNGSDWVQKGNDLRGNPSTNVKLGASISINSAGDRVIIGDPQDGTSGKQGKVYIFSWDGSSWVKEDSIFADQDNYAFGNSVAMSGNGNTVAIGAPGYPPYNQTTGTVEVYERSNPPTSPTNVQEPDRETKVQAFIRDKNLVVKYALTENVQTAEEITIAIYNVSGQQIFQKKLAYRGIIEIPLSEINGSKMIYVAFETDKQVSDRIVIPVHIYE